MTSTLVDIVSTAQGEMGLFPLATTVSGATDDGTQQLLNLLNAVGRELMVARDWRLLEEEAIINVLAPIIQTGTVTTGSPTVTGLASTTGIVANTWVATGQGIAQAARVVSVTPTTVTLNELSVQTHTGPVTFSQDTYPVPQDFRHFVNRTQWDRTRRWELLGPTSPQEDQWMRSGIAATGPRRRFRQVGRDANSFRIWPPPSSSDAPSTLVFDYITAFWASAADGTPKGAYTLDSDTCVFPDDVMIAGLKARFFQTKGFDVSVYGPDYQRAKDTAMAQDGGAKTVNMGRKRWPVLLSGANIPDSGFGTGA